MKHITSLITVITLALASTSAFAGSCGGCGDKEKDKDKDKAPGTTNMVRNFQVASEPTGDKEKDKGTCGGKEGC